MSKLLSTAAFGFGLIAAEFAFAAEKSVTLAVQNMTCALCPRTVKASLEAVPGVTNVVVSAEDKTAAMTARRRSTRLLRQQRMRAIPRRAKARRHAAAG
jgi:mercuric ion binding protein